MEEVLSNQQARPGDATQLMHTIFSSDDEMISFYLTLNCFMNPESYLVERTDRKRLHYSAKKFSTSLPVRFLYSSFIDFSNWTRHSFFFSFAV